MVSTHFGLWPQEVFFAYASEVPVLDELKAARERAGLTQTELAKRIGVARPSISIMEAGRARPALDTAEEWARACGAELTVVGAAEAKVVSTLGTMTDAEREFATRLLRGLPHLNSTFRDMLSLMLTQIEAEEAKRSSG